MTSSASHCEDRKHTQPPAALPTFTLPSRFCLPALQHGVRNSLLVAPMPTASTSQILGNNECFEPYTSNIYVRRVLSGERGGRHAGKRVALRIGPCTSCQASRPAALLFGL